MWQVVMFVTYFFLAMPLRHGYPIQLVTCVVVLTSGCNKQQQPNEQKRRCDNQAAATKNKRKRIQENTNTQQKKTMNIFTLIAGGRNQNRRLKHTHATDDK